MRHWLALLTLGLAAAALGMYGDSAPAGHTGGFGEPTCTQCHLGQPVNDAGGTLAIVGVPRRYRPDSSYTIGVSLTRPELHRAGFQLAVRYQGGSREGAQAGTLVPPDGRAAITTASNGVAYLGHTAAGSRGDASGTIRWAFVWTAPASGGGTVVVDIAANASNDDDSPLGDWIYTLRKMSEPAGS